MGVSLSIIFNRTNLKLAKKKYPIHIRITVDRKTDYLHTGVSIEKEFWQSRDNKWVKETHLNNHEMNKCISDLRNRLNSHIWQLKNNSKPINIQLLKDFHKRKTDSANFNEFVNEYINTRKWASLNTRKAYVTFQKHINAFNSKIKFSQLTESLVKDFLIYLENEIKLKGITIKKNKDKFSKIVQEAVKQNVIDINGNPFFTSEFKIKTTKASRIFLDIDEIIKIKSISFSKDNQHLDKHRWHFLFLCCSGLYYSDLKKLKWESLGKNSDGYYIIDKRFKNDETFQIPLYKFDTTTQIINSLGDKNSEYIFTDTIEEQPFNRELKTIAQLVGIKKRLYNKVGRHTYAQLLIKLGIERQFLSRMLGHQKEETTQHYYSVSMHDLEDKIKGVNFNELGL